MAVYNLKRLVVMKPRLIASFYVMQGSFWCDVISAPAGHHRGTFASHEDLCLFLLPISHDCHRTLMEASSGDLSHLLALLIMVLGLTQSGVAITRQAWWLINPLCMQIVVLCIPNEGSSDSHACGCAAPSVPSCPSGTNGHCKSPHKERQNQL